MKIYVNVKSDNLEVSSELNTEDIPYITKLLLEGKFKLFNFTIRPSFKLSLNSMDFIYQISKHYQDVDDYGKFRTCNGYYSVFVDYFRLKYCFLGLKAFRLNPEVKEDEEFTVFYNILLNVGTNLRDFFRDGEMLMKEEQLDKKERDEIISIKSNSEVDTGSLKIKYNYVSKIALSSLNNIIDTFSNLKFERTDIVSKLSSLRDSLEVYKV